MMWLGVRDAAKVIHGTGQSIPPCTTFVAVHQERPPQPFAPHLADRRTVWGDGEVIPPEHGGRIGAVNRRQVHGFPRVAVAQ